MEQKRKSEGDEALRERIRELLMEGGPLTAKQLRRALSSDGRKGYERKDVNRVLYHSDALFVKRTPQGGAPVWALANPAAGQDSTPPRDGDPTDPPLAVYVDTATVSDIPLEEVVALDDATVYQYLPKNNRPPAGSPNLHVTVYDPEMPFFVETAIATHVAANIDRLEGYRILIASKRAFLRAFPQNYGRSFDIRVCPSWKDLRLEL